MLTALQARHPEQRIQVWFQDEARFGQQGCNSRVGADPGRRPRAPRQTEYEFVYRFGALCPDTGESTAWLMPRANTETMNGQLRSLVTHCRPMSTPSWFSTAPAGTPATGSRSLTIFSLVHLPPCAPELNPVELVWRELRQRYFSNRIYSDSSQLEDAVGPAWNRLADDLPRLHSLTDYPWIRAARPTVAGKDI